MARLSVIPLLVVAVILGSAPRAEADTFGSGANSFQIEFVTIGHPGNPPDAPPNPAGAVPYVHRIGKYEVSERMIEAANALGGLGITIDSRGPDYPATSVTWFEAARFVNWLNTSTGATPAYKFDAGGNFQLWAPSDPGYDATNLYRNKLARYFLPSTDEWHKAAYYDAVAQLYYDYPTGSDSVPDGIDFPGDTAFDAVFFDGGSNLGPNNVFNVGIASPNGVFGLGGNVFEWDESAFDRVNSSPSKQRRTSGGGWGSADTTLNATNTLGGILPGFEGSFVGFRVSIVPEPDSLATGLLLFALTHGFRPRMRIMERRR